VSLADASIRNAVAAVEPGRWVVGVSGGADSVALLLSLRLFRPDLDLFVAHLNHQTRGEESDADREFAVSFGESVGVPVVARSLDAFTHVQHPNLEARFRLARLALFREIATSHRAAGVILAQHADDRAETTLMRLLRSVEPGALDAIRGNVILEGLRVVRPLLGVRRKELERFLRERGQTWRDDSSNRSDAFARNRLRMFLRSRPQFSEALLRLAEAAGRYRAWVEACSPELPTQLSSGDLADLPDPLARHSVRRWIRACGIGMDSVSPALVKAILTMARDSASRPAVNLPGGAIARRRRRIIEIERPSDSK
jgi:tRNA(Ile)-lysidine synthase